MGWVHSPVWTANKTCVVPGDFIAAKPINFQQVPHQLTAGAGYILFLEIEVPKDSNGKPPRPQADKPYNFAKVKEMSKCKGMSKCTELWKRSKGKFRGRASVQPNWNPLTAGAKFCATLHCCWAGTCNSTVNQTGGGIRIYWLDESDSKGEVKNAQHVTNMHVVQYGLWENGIQA